MDGLTIGLILITALLAVAVGALAYLLFKRMPKGEEGGASWPYQIGVLISANEALFIGQRR